MTAAHAERGQVLPLVALCLAVLMGFAGLAVDVGYWSYQQRQQQNAADAAALGGAQALARNGCSSSSAAVAAGTLDATANGYTSSGGAGPIIVNVTNPPASGAFAGQGCAVQATVTNRNVSRFFSRLLGQSVIPISTSAVATVSHNNNGCMFLLDPSRPLQFSGTTVNSPSCGILSNNSPVQVSGSNIGVASFGYAGSFQNSGSSFPDGQPTQIPPVADPCPEIAGCAYLAANPPPSNSCSSRFISGQTTSIGPGCYSSLQISGSTVTMLPGQYIFTGPVQDSGSTVTGTGVSMYVANGGGPVQFSGANDSFSAPTTGNNANVLFYQVPGNSSAVQFSGSNAGLSGLIYAPSAIGQVSGGNGQYVVLVFGSMQFSGSTALDFAGPIAGHSIIANAVLAQ